MTATLADIVSQPRFQSYVNAAGSEERAAELYAWNLRLSSSAYGAIQMCEIVVRNSMDLQLRKWNQSKGHSEHWTLDPAPLLGSALGEVEDALGKAAAKARSALRKKREPNHDDVLAQLSFGTWRYLMPPRSQHHAKDRLWDECLRNAFTNVQGRNPRLLLPGWLSIAYDLRNRVAHHEPIFHLSIRDKRRVLKDITDAVSRPAKSWFNANDTLAATVTEYQQWCKGAGISPNPT